MKRNQLDERAGAYARIWLHLLKEGGWHSHRELFSAVVVDSKNTSMLLNQMINAGYIAKRDGERGKMEYGVQNHCRVPRFLSIGDVSDAFGG